MSVQFTCSIWKLCLLWPRVLPLSQCHRVWLINSMYMFHVILSVLLMTEHLATKLTHEVFPVAMLGIPVITQSLLWLEHFATLHTHVLLLLSIYPGPAYGPLQARSIRIEGCWGVHHGVHGACSSRRTATLHTTGTWVEGRLGGSVAETSWGVCLLEGAVALLLGWLLRLPCLARASHWPSLLQQTTHSGCLDSALYITNDVRTLYALGKNHLWRQCHWWLQNGFQLADRAESEISLAGLLSLECRLSCITLWQHKQRWHRPLTKSCHRRTWGWSNKLTRWQLSLVSGRWSTWTWQSRHQRLARLSRRGLHLAESSDTTNDNLRHVGCQICKGKTEFTMTWHLGSRPDSCKHMKYLILSNWREIYLLQRRHTRKGTQSCSFQRVAGSIVKEWAHMKMLGELDLQHMPYNKGFLWAGAV